MPSNPSQALRTNQAERSSPRARTSRIGWRWTAFRAAAVYALISFLWIALSDTAVGLFVPAGWPQQEVSLVKGFGYVLAFAVVLYYLVRATIRASEDSAQAHRESERQFRELLDGVDLLAVILDADGRMTFCNEGVVKATGWPRNELLGQSFFDTLLPDLEARARWASSLQNATMGVGEQRRAEVEVITRIGERRTVRWTATVLRGTRGDVIGGAAVGEDITDRQRFEAAMQQALKMEALGRLAGSVAHDFNNLLTAITGYADLVLMDLPADSRVAEDIREIRRAAERASAMTGQLLAFSRRRPIESMPVDLSATVAAMEPMLRRLIGEQISLAAEIQPDCWVVADPSLLEQAVLNLSVNARDAMPDGGRLRIEIREADEALVAERRPLGGRTGRHIAMSVSDTGTGIPPEVLPHLFEPFFTTKPKGKGTGLGLATVYTALTGAGGQVWVESEPGKGTRFIALLPATDERMAPARDEAAVPVRAAPVGGRILVAEDDPAVLALVRTVLVREGYAVLEASNGGDALALSEQRDVDLLISDLVMPGMGGRELVGRVRSGRRRIPALFISGYDEDAELLERGRESLDSPLLQKPFTAAELLAAVRLALSNEPGPRVAGDGRPGTSFGEGASGHALA